MSKIETGTTRWEVRMQPLCYAVPPTYLNSLHDTHSLGQSILWWRTCGLGLEVIAGHIDPSSNLCLGYLPWRLVNELRTSPGLANIIESYAHVRSGPSFRFATIIRSLIKAKGQKAMSQPIQVNNIIAVNNCDFIKSQCVKRYAKSIVGFTYFNSFWAAAKCNDDFDPDKCDEKWKLRHLICLII